MTVSTKKKFHLYSLKKIKNSSDFHLKLEQSLSKSTIVKQQSMASLVERYSAHASAVEGSLKPGIFQVVEAKT
jgi:hypothetical protein